MNLKIGSHSFHLSLTLLALLAGALVVYGRSGGSPALAQWTASVHQELATDRTWRARAAALSGRAAHARAAANVLQDSMGVLTAAFDSLLRAAQQPGGPPVSLGQLGVACHAALTACQQRGDSLARADSLDRLAAQANFARAVHADSLLHQGAAAADCRVLFLKCPTRTQAFEAGSALAAILFLALRAARLF